MLAADKFCVKELDAKYEKYLASDKPADRKVLADLAVTDPAGFSALAQSARTALGLA